MYLVNPTMVCSCRYSCFDLLVALVDCQVEVCPSRLHHICQGEYVVLNHIAFDGAERSGAEDLLRLCWIATGPGRARDIEEGGVQHCVGYR